MQSGGAQRAADHDHAAVRLYAQHLERVDAAGVAAPSAEVAVELEGGDVASLKTSAG